MEILIVDDHPVFRAGLRQILLDCCQDLVIAEVGSGIEALEYVNAQPPDAVVLDVSLPDINGIEVLRRIRRAHRSLPVILLTMHSEEQYEDSASKAGASAFLSKAVEPEKLAEAILWFAGRPLSRNGVSQVDSKPNRSQKEGRLPEEPSDETRKLL